MNKLVKHEVKHDVKQNVKSNIKDEKATTSQEPHSSTLAGETAALGKAALKTAANSVQYAFLSASNFVLTHMKRTIEGFVPSGDKLQDKENLNKSLLSSIEQSVKTPEFQRKWKEFAILFAGLLKTLFTVAAKTTANEAEALADIFETTAIKIFKKGARGTISAVSDVLSDVPGLGAIIALLSVMTTVVNIGATIIIGMFELTAKMVNALTEVVGGTLNPAVKAIKSFKGIMSSLTNLPKNARKKLEAHNKAQSIAQQPQEAPTRFTSTIPKKGGTRKTRRRKKSRNNKRKYTRKR